MSFILQMQFYKNLSIGLKDIVWTYGDEAKDEVNNGEYVDVDEFREM